MPRSCATSRSRSINSRENLQQAVQELERRRQLMETVLENIPDRGNSLDSTGAILARISRSRGMFGGGRRFVLARSILGGDAGRMVQSLCAGSLRMGVVSREIETVVSGASASRRDRKLAWAAPRQFWFWCWFAMI